MQLIIMSVTASVFAILWLTTLAILIRTKKKPQKQLTVDAQALLGDIMSSGAVLRVEVLDPNNLLYYRGS